MANAILAKAKEKLLKGDLDFDNSIKAALIDTGLYTRDDTDEFYSEIASGARVALSPALASKTFTNGVFDAADVTLPTVSGATCELIAIILDTGSAATSPIIGFIDTLSSGAFPIIPNGGDILIQWNATGILAL